MTVSLEEQIRLVADAAFAETAPVVVPLPDGRPVHGSRVRRRMLLVAACIVVLVGGLVALSTQSKDDSLNLDNGPVTDFAEGFSARGALREVPLLDYAPTVGTSLAGADVAAIADLTGIERPDVIDPSTLDEWGWLRSSGARTRGATPIVVFPYHQLMQAGYFSSEAFEAELGWSAADVDSYMSVEPTAPPVPFDVVTMRTDLDGLAREASDDGIIGIGTAEEGERSVKDRTDLRPVGRSWRVGVDADRSMIAVSYGSPLISSWLDRDEKTWADISPLEIAASALDRDPDLYAFQMVFFDDLAAPGVGADADLGPDDAAEQRSVAVAYGWSGIGDTQRTTIVYVYADDATAAEALGPIEQLFVPDVVLRNDVTIGDVFLVGDIEAVGRAVIVTGKAAPGAPLNPRAWGS